MVPIISQLNLLPLCRLSIVLLRKPNKMVSPEVLIVGSGPAGLVLALALVKNGIAVRIIEKDTEYNIGERGAGVMPRTLEIENFLGVGEDVQRSGLGSPAINVFDPKDPHRIVKSFDMLPKVAPTPAFPITEAAMIGQWLHQQILRQHLEKLGCHVELGCMLKAIEQKDGGVVAHLLKTKEGKQLEETASFSYVVGADGAHSTVRKLLNIDFVGESRDTRVYLVDARIEGMPPKGKDFCVFGGANLRYTVREGVFQMLLVGDVDFESLKSGSIEAIQSTFNTLSGRSDLKITEVLYHGEWRPNIRVAERFGTGRVFIVGDAAHAHPPNGAQGLNTSVQDSFNLAWKLALSLRSRASPALLDSYESERLPVIAEMLNITTGLFKEIESKSETRRGIEAAQEQAAAKSKDEEKQYTRDWKLFQLDVNYRWSEIVFDERFTKKDTSADIERHAYGTAGHDVRAGDRAPDAPGLTCLTMSASVSTPTRLFDIFKPMMHTVLVFTANSPGASTSRLLVPFSKIPKELVQFALILPPAASESEVGNSPVNMSFAFSDCEGHAYNEYGLKPDGKEPWMVIVRPDAMIGAFVKSAEGVEKYFQLVFG